MTARARCSDLALANPSGTAIALAPGSTVGVYVAGTAGTLSETALPQTLYAGKTGGTTKGGNPFTVDADGSFVFYVPTPDACDLKVTLPAGAGVTISQHVPILHDPGDLEAHVGFIDALTANPHAPPYGAVGDCQQVEDAFTTSGSPIIISSSAAFTLRDVGKLIRLQEKTVDGTTGAVSYAIVVGDATGVVPVTIIGYTSPTQVTVSANATASASSVRLIWGTDDTVAVQAMVTRGGQDDLLDGSFAVRSTITLGNGSATANSTIQNVRLSGSTTLSAAAQAATFAAAEETLLGFPSLVWMGPVDGTMMKMLGPIQNCRIEHIGFDCAYTAATALETWDLQQSEIDTCKAIGYTSIGFAQYAYAYGHASSSAHLLISANASTHCTISRWFGFSQGASAIGMAIGVDSIPLQPFITGSSGPRLTGGFGPDVSQCSYRDCVIRQGTGLASPHAATGIGLLLQFMDGNTFEHCSFAAAIPIMVKPPATTDATGGAFPNLVVMVNVQIDNGMNAWGDCQINTTNAAWTAPHKLLNISPHALADGATAMPATFGWSITTKGGLGGDWTFANGLTVSQTLLVGGVAQFNSALTAAGVIATSGGFDIRTSGGFGLDATSAIYRKKLYDQSGVLNGAVLDLGTRFGTLQVTDVTNKKQCEVFLNGPDHTVTQKSNGITGFALTNAGVAIRIYWDGISAYKLTNGTGGTVTVRVIFEGSDS